MMPLASFCAVASAQYQPQPNSAAKSTPPTKLHPQTQTSQPVKTQPQKKVSRSHAARSRKTALVERPVTDFLPTACTTEYVVPPGDVYGAYVPYVAPAQPTGCTTPNAQAARINSPLANSSAVQKQQPDSVVNSTPLNLALPAGSLASPTGTLALPGSSLVLPTIILTQPATKLAQPASSDLALKPEAASSTGDSPAEGGYVRPVRMHRAPTIPQEIRRFHSLAVGFTAGTLGAGIEVATPMAYRLNLRSSVNFFAFNDPFSIDGVNYNARLHLKSGAASVDWFPRGGGFHISPGVLFVKNTLSAPASVDPGKTFVLGTQTFLNSVDDPVNGYSSVIYSRKYAPMLLVGFGNIIPRSNRHLSLPIEFGAAYTGPPQINVTLGGTACTTNGCVDFVTNADAQKYLKQEINILNEDLKRYPVFPIVSVGLGYHF